MWFQQSCFNRVTKQNHFSACVLIFCISSKHLFLGTLLGGCFEVKTWHKKNCQKVLEVYGSPFKCRPHKGVFRTQSNICDEHFFWKCSYPLLVINCFCKGASSQMFDWVQNASEVFCNKWCSHKFWKIHKKTPVLQFFLQLY